MSLWYCATCDVNYGPGPVHYVCGDIGERIEPELGWAYVCPLCREPVTGTGNVPPSHGCITEKAIRVLIREEIAKWMANVPTSKSP